ncbi:hypothetical protein BCR44DRAFT_1109461 [Catenaria anguillulae PL171]|uniref:Uncharacterized protein n=1 Tax=Catenaria anguillulae PL171 TaxID=765915 RepID=A0A1Y2HMU7_9FUNG|nr:hypothetical protein BCR44DRAFT_1109461 [Catenaria anguillulae PL171]
MIRVCPFVPAGALHSAMTVPSPLLPCIVTACNRRRLPVLSSYDHRPHARPSPPPSPPIGTHPATAPLTPNIRLQTIRIASKSD